MTGIENRLMCGYCGRVFTDVSELESHLFFKHEAEAGA